MRWTVVLLATLLLGHVRDARADAKIEQLAKGYEREQPSCKIHEDGLAKMLDGATMLLERSSEDGLADDIKTLHDAHEVVASFCTALATTIDFLRSDPSASYKSLEKQIGERETHIRALRASSKKVLEQTEPLIQRWIKKINTARIDNDKAAVTTTTKPAPAQEPKKDPAPVAAPQPKPEPKQDSKPAPTKPTISDAPAPAPKPEPPAPKPADATPLSAKFPSARKVKLPQLGGKWDVRGDSTTDVADYVENDTHTSVVAEAFSGVSCTAQLARLQAKAYGRQATKEQAGKGQAWRVRLPSSDTPTIVACASTRTGSALVTFDVPDSVHPDLSELAAAMLAALAK